MPRDKKLRSSFSNVSDLLRDTADRGDTLADEFEALTKQREIIKRLIALRVRAGLSQGQIAEKMGCSQSCVSKLECGLDDDLKLGEYRKYLCAVGMEPVIGALREGRTTVDEIKLLALGIRKRLDSLASMAKDDDTVAKGIAHFYAEAFFNFYDMVAESAAKLPDRPDGNGPYIQFGLIEDSSPLLEIEISQTIRGRLSQHPNDRHCVR